MVKILAMRSLTEKEELIMQVLWRLNKAFVKEIIQHLPEPKPHYNTVSTTVRIMQDKGLVGYESLGNSHRYFPILSKENYRNKTLKGLLEKYFDNSYKGMVAYFAREEKLTETDLREILGMINKEDSILIISNSGETTEIISILPALKRSTPNIFTLTNNSQSTIAKAGKISITINANAEACPLDLTPTSSTTITSLDCNNLTICLVLTAPHHLIPASVFEMKYKHLLVKINIPSLPLPLKNPLFSCQTERTCA